MDELIRHWGLIPIFIALYFENVALVGIFVPGVTVLVTAGFLAGIGELDPTAVFWTAWLGIALGDATCYIIGRFFLTKLPKVGRLVGRLDPDKLTHWTILFFQFPVPTRIAIPLLAGSIRVPPVRALMVDLASTTIFVLTIGGTGFIAGTSLAEASAAIFIADNLQFLFLGIFALFAISLLVRWWRATGTRLSRKTRTSTLPASGPPLRDPALRWESRDFDNGDVTLRTLVSPRNEDVGRPTIIFVAGWASTIFTWRYFLDALSETCNLVYVETREKVSTKWRDRPSQKIDDLVSDIVAMVQQQAELVGSGKIILMGASTGANLAYEAAKSCGQSMRGLVLLTPHEVSPIPSYTILLDFLPRFALPRVSWLLENLATRDVLPAKLKQQKAGLVAAVSAGDLARLRQSAREWRSFRLDTSVVPGMPRTLVIVARADKVHPMEGGRRIADVIDRSELREVNGFVSVHGKSLASDIAIWCLDLVRAVPE